MRVLVIGAGALGGYFGACLARANRDVTFLVRPRRAEQLARDGLRVVSPHGDFTVPAATVLADDLREAFDLILVGTKSYSLHEAMEQFAPAVGSTTAILPILNGMAHLDSSERPFRRRTCAGWHGAYQCGARRRWARRACWPPFTTSSSVRSPAGSANGPARCQRSSRQRLQCEGERNGHAGHVGQMGQNWRTGAGMTCLMRASFGDILAAPGGREAILRLFAECSAVATAAGFPPRPAFIEFVTDDVHHGGIADQGVDAPRHRARLRH